MECAGQTVANLPPDQRLPLVSGGFRRRAYCLCDSYGMDSVCGNEVFGHAGDDVRCLVSRPLGIWCLGPFENFVTHVLVNPRRIYVPKLPLLGRECGREGV